MTAKPAFDASELRTLAADMRAVPEQLNRHVVPIVKKGAQNIKDEIAGNFERSVHFKPVAHTVDYDIRQESFMGDGVIEAEIGPNKDVRGVTGKRRTTAGRDRVAFNESDFTTGSQSPAALANIAIFPSPGRRGTPTVPDPQIALDNEAKNFEAALSDLLDDVL